MDRCPECGAVFVKAWTGKSSKRRKEAFLCGSVWDGRFLVRTAPCYRAEIEKLKRELLAARGGRSD